MAFKGNHHHHTTTSIWNNNGSVYVFGATNRPDDLDEALRRPGRFDREITFKTPTIDGKYLKISLRSIKMSKSFDYYGIAKRAVGYTGADLFALCREAALKAVLSSDEIMNNILRRH